MLPWSLSLLVLLVGTVLTQGSTINTPLKAETDCLMRQLAINSSSALLPKCRLWDLAGCQTQMDAVFASLNRVSCKTLQLPKATTSKVTKETSSLNAATSQVYVSTLLGKDTQTGTKALPVKTLAKALELVAAMNKPNQVKQINLDGGEYVLSNTVEINSLHNNVQIVGPSSGSPPSVLSATLDLGQLTWKTYSGKIVQATLTAQQTAQLDNLSQLFINGKPAIRARFPNVAKFTDFQYSTVKAKSWGKGVATKIVASKTINRDMTPPGVKYMPKSTPFNRFSMGFADTSSKNPVLFSPPASYFLDPTHMAQGGCKHTLPTSITFKSKTFPNVWKKPTLARFHALHWYGWGLWSFSVKAQTSTMVSFSGGGWQEARGDCGKGGNLWFVDNALELLDSPNEFFLDLVAKQLYYYPATDLDNPLLSKTVQVELGKRLISLVAVNQATQVSFSNVQFRGGYETTMMPFEVPSGGDWSLHRSAALFVNASTQVLVEDCQFQYNAGNALFIHGNSTNVQVTRNEFFGIGSSCVLVGGDPGYFTPDPWVIKAFPQSITIKGNVMSNFGLSVKQSSGVFISLASQVSVVGNTIYNGPRAGITINDQFAGGHLVQQNLVFEQTQETSDNGPFIVWHRQMFQGGNEKLFDVVENNFFLGTAGVGSDGGGKGINVDDGAFRVKSRNNVVVWGFHKIKGAEVEVVGNVFVNPITTSCVYFSYFTRTPSQLSYKGNTCVSSYPPYAFGIATNALPGVCAVANFQSSNNAFYYDGKSQVMENCAKSWSYWTKTWKQDANSVYSKARPQAQAVGNMVKQKLSWI
ncbi:hypothetical protein BASA81_010558 [Batrachochytrium salamandrivorans]|nr:hypothetical protein BASA81_010558 [Batrachochytrium salamandrivorans]